ncbi:hypothetical protein AMS68_007194 [Peltaster fructicola]|uniref:VWFA domain-containing protein n=1 Tax=Peltaster fructicola TaxID=286661 RepID=A0A6H0Y3T1_9PEZI|nr:hypothetical protein AMS68_007194 [Peltaster fructicola]
MSKPQIQTDLLQRLQALLPLEENELKQVLDYSATLPSDAAKTHLQELLGDGPEAAQFIDDFQHRQTETSLADSMKNTHIYDTDVKTGNGIPASDVKSSQDRKTLPSTAPPAQQHASSSNQQQYSQRVWVNGVSHMANIRAADEQDIQQHLQTVQYNHHIFNSDIDPEHETEYYCRCDICVYKERKYYRYAMQNQWSEAVKYPGETTYTDEKNLNGKLYQPYGRIGRVGYPDSNWSLSERNPYVYRVASPFGTAWSQSPWRPSIPIPAYYTAHIQQMIAMNNQLNASAQAYVNTLEPRYNIWDDTVRERELATVAEAEARHVEATQKSKMKKFKKSLGVRSSEEKANAKAKSTIHGGLALRNQIVEEEQGRWPDQQWRNLVMSYQEHVGMSKMIQTLRRQQPLQYLHLLRAGYFEPIPVAWANQASNPLKFSIEALAGWRGITPAWRGYEDTAEERLYWVLNHREGSVGMRMKPDRISEMNMAQQRMARAVEPPPAYFAADDTCHVQHMTDGYTKQVMPTPFVAIDQPETPADDTMILLDISGSMDFQPQRPVYQEYLITGFTHSTQPKNKDVAKAVIRRFTDAMANHDNHSGYDLVTFSSDAHYMGSVTHQNLDDTWSRIRFGGTTRVMTGWQLCKERHFQKHSQSATYHSVYGWQAGPETPILRLLLLLDGEATDMDEFELDLLGSSWAHVTIFLIGVDGCPHHHRHANELDRIGSVNRHVSFVDAQGNFPERYITHELLKRHLGYDISMQEFQQMEELPPYTQF